MITRSQSYLQTALLLTAASEAKRIRSRKKEKVSPVNKEEEKVEKAKKGKTLSLENKSGMNKKRRERERTEKEMDAELKKMLEVTGKALVIKRVKWNTFSFQVGGI